MKRQAIPLIAAVMVFTGCATRAPRNWSQLHVGMSRPEVQALLGQPDSVSQPVNFTPIVQAVATNAPPSKAEAFGAFLSEMVDRSRERWAYGKDTFIGKPTKAYSVYFDEDGTVTGFRKPE